MAAAAVALLGILPLDVIAATDLHADLPLAVFLAVTVYAVLRGEAAVRAGRAWFFVGGISLGLAVVSKEVALALLVVLALRLVIVRPPARMVAAYGWLVFGVLAVTAIEMVWLGAVTGNPLYRYLGPIARFHAATVLATPPGHGWMLGYPAMLLNPLSGSFGYFAGIVYFALAATIFRRGDRRVLQLTVWWAGLLFIFNFAPLDASFTRPLFHHFARTLHPLLLPFVLASALWLGEGLRGRRLLRVCGIVAMMTLAIAGIWATHRDYRSSAAVARQAAPVIARLPPNARIVTDSLTASQLRFLVPERRERIVSYSSGQVVSGDRPVFILADPLFLAQARMKGNVPPAAMITPPASWERLAQFDRRPRASLRAIVGQLLGWHLAPSPEAGVAELWRVRP